MKIKAENVKFMCKVSCYGYYSDDTIHYSKMDMDNTDECMNFIKQCAVEYYHNWDGKLYYEIIPYIPSMYNHGSYNLSCTNNKLYVYNNDGILIDGASKAQAKEFVE